MAVLLALVGWWLFWWLFWLAVGGDVVDLVVDVVVGGEDVATGTAQQ